MLAASKLACVRGGRTVFTGIEFELEPGDTLVLQGPNGSGKSSLLRLLAGFLSPAAGHLAWAGQPIGRDLSAQRARLHYVGHADAIKGLLSVRENLTFALAVTGAPRGAVDRALEGFDLLALADTPARLLSAGQRRRLALARLLANDRPLWLLDEPGVGLDAANRRRLEGAVADHRDAGGITVLATHGDIAVPDALILEMAG